MATALLLHDEIDLTLSTMTKTTNLIPPVGFGTARLKGQECESAVSIAIQSGYRHFDCAQFYGNEVHVGKALVSAIESKKVKRDEFFITSKCWNDRHRQKDVWQSCQQTIKDLGIGYLDLYLIHWPVAWVKGTAGCPDFGVTIMETWRAMEKLVDQGLVKSIGVSNFGPKRLTKLLQEARIPPLANQLELHPYLSQTKLVEFCSFHNIQCVAWSPLAKFSSRLCHHPVILQIAKQIGYSPSQVILRWNIQRGVAVIPRSSSQNHIEENLKTSELQLSQDDMNLISDLDQHKRIFPDLVGVFEETTFFPYHIIGYLANTIGVLVWMIIPHVFDFSNPQYSMWEIFAWKEKIRWADQLRIGVILLGASVGVCRFFQ